MIYAESRFNAGKWKSNLISILKFFGMKSKWTQILLNNSPFTVINPNVHRDLPGTDETLIGWKKTLCWPYSPVIPTHECQGIFGQAEVDWWGNPPVRTFKGGNHSLICCLYPRKKFNQDWGKSLFWFSGLPFDFRNGGYRAVVPLAMRYIPQRCVGKVAFGI